MGRINWSRGFRRAWYFVLGLIWFVTVAVQAAEFASGSLTPAEAGAALGYLLMFTVVWLLIGGAVSWVFRGFSRD